METHTERERDVHAHTLRFIVHSRKGCSIADRHSLCLCPFKKQFKIASISTETLPLDLSFALKLVINYCMFKFP